MRCWAIHWAVLSVTMPRSAARTCAAFADGANPMTLPGPCSASHIARTPAIVVVFPVPAGPTSTSTTRPGGDDLHRGRCLILGRQRDTHGRAAVCAATRSARSGLTAGAGRGPSARREQRVLGLAGHEPR